jgi:hypothetical protein
MTDLHEGFRHRAGGPETSALADRAVSRTAPNQRLALLQAWGTDAAYGGFGVTDEKAAEGAALLHPTLFGPRSCPWKRAGELRAEGYLRWLLDDEGKPVTRKGSGGVAQQVSVITEFGEALLRRKGLA